MLLLAACDKDEQKPAAPPPTPEVGVITVRPQSVPVVTVLPGRVAPFLVAEVRARVDGIVLRRLTRLRSTARERRGRRRKPT